MSYLLFESAMTVNEVAARLDVPERTVYTWIRRGCCSTKLESTYVGGRVRTSWQAVERFMLECNRRGRTRTKRSATPEFIR